MSLLHAMGIELRKGNIKKERFCPSHNHITSVLRLFHVQLYRLVGLVILATVHYPYLPHVTGHRAL